MVIRGISYTAISIFTVMCLLPFVLIVSASFSSESAIMKSGFGLLPKDFTFTAYEYIFRAPRQIIGSYVVTIVMTVAGTAIGLFIIAMTGIRALPAGLPAAQLHRVLHLLHDAVLGRPRARRSCGSDATWACGETTWRSSSRC